MNPSPEAITAIQTRVAAVSAWSKTDAEVLADLNADTVANPTAQTQVPKPFTYMDVLQLLSPDSWGKLRASGLLPRVLDDINSMNRNAVSNWATSLSVGTTNYPAILTTDESNSVVALMSSTEADPTWQATVPNVEATIGRALDIQDIKTARGNN